MINHDSEYKSSYITNSGVAMGKLSRQGSSVESAHSTTVHVHTPECKQFGHPSHPPKDRASPTGEQGTCDFHCCAIHDDGTPAGTGATTKPPSRQHSQEHRQQSTSRQQSQESQQQRQQSQEGPQQLITHQQIQVQVPTLQLPSSQSHQHHHQQQQ